MSSPLILLCKNIYLIKVILQDNRGRKGRGYRILLCFIEITENWNIYI